MPRAQQTHANAPLLARLRGAAGRGVAVLAGTGLLLLLGAATATAMPLPAGSVTTPELRAETGGTGTDDAWGEAGADVVSTAGAVVQIARQYVGTPYVWGGSTPAGFDCSGYTQYVFAQLGIQLPRTADAQRYAGYVVSAAEARPGDLIWSPGHIAIYTGNGNHIAARNPSTPLYESPIFMADPVFIRVPAGGGMDLMADAG